MSAPTDAALARALERAGRAHARAASAWQSAADAGEIDQDIADEVSDHARSAIAHLEAGRWDDARASAELCVELDETEARGDTWRDFGLLVEEAAETGIAVA